MTDKNEYIGESFMEIVSLHRLLDDLFLKHQTALICMDGEQAAYYYSTFKQMLALHIHHEDDLLLPVFHRIGDIKRWPGTLFSGEHRKLEAFLGRIDTALDELGEPTPAKALQIVEALDVEGGLKRLMEHHDEREQQCLFLVLDSVTERVERRALLARVFAEWCSLYDRLTASPLLSRENPGL